MSVTADDPVITAERRVDLERQKLDELRARLIRGDESVTATQLAEASAAVDRAELLVEHARRHIESPGFRRQQEAQARLEERRRRAREQRQQQRRAEWLRAIETKRPDGTSLAEVQILDLKRSGSPLNFEPEYVELLVEHGLGHLVRPAGSATPWPDGLPPVEP